VRDAVLRWFQLLQHCDEETDFINRQLVCKRPEHPSLLLSQLPLDDAVAILRLAVEVRSEAQPHLLGHAGCFLAEHDVPGYGSVALEYARRAVDLVRDHDSKRMISTILTIKAQVLKAVLLYALSSMADGKARAAALLHGESICQLWDEPKKTLDAGWWRSHDECNSHTAVIAVRLQLEVLKMLQGEDTPDAMKVAQDLKLRSLEWLQRLEMAVHEHRISDCSRAADDLAVLRDQRGRQTGDCITRDCLVKALREQNAAALARAPELLPIGTNTACAIGDRQTVLQALGSFLVAREPTCAWYHAHHFIQLVLQEGVHSDATKEWTAAFALEKMRFVEPPMLHLRYAHALQVRWFAALYLLVGDGGQLQGQLACAHGKFQDRVGAAWTVLAGTAPDLRRLRKRPATLEECHRGCLREDGQAELDVGGSSFLIPIDNLPPRLKVLPEDRQGTAVAYELRLGPRESSKADLGLFGVFMELL
jgi:hypothetical protein